jgi:alcohol dehydrogenase-like protein
MRALRFYGARQLVVDKVPEPGSPGPGEVLLQPAMCGICGTDLHEYTDGPIVTPAQRHPLTGAELPQIMGHEFSAVVAATGPSVSHVHEGDLCTVMPLISCGHCHECVRGRSHLCRTMACTGLSSAWGGLADLAIVSARQVVPVPGTLTPQQAALIEPTAVAAYGVDRGRLQPGQTVLVTGAGPIGALATMYALAGGARRVIVSEPDPVRRQRAAGLGDGLGEVITADRRDRGRPGGGVRRGSGRTEPVHRQCPAGRHCGADGPAHPAGRDPGRDPRTQGPDADRHLVLPGAGLPPGGRAGGQWPAAGGTGDQLGGATGVRGGRRFRAADHPGDR